MDLKVSGRSRKAARRLPDRPRCPTTEGPCSGQNKRDLVHHLSADAWFRRLASHQRLSLVSRPNLSEPVVHTERDARLLVMQGRIQRRIGRVAAREMRVIDIRVKQRALRQRIGDAQDRHVLSAAHAAGRVLVVVVGGRRGGWMSR